MINEIERKTFWDDNITTPKQNSSNIYSKVESLIISWELDERKTTEQLTKDIIKLFEKYGDKSI